MYVISTFKKVLSILDKKQKRNLFLLVVLMLFAGILESIGISLIVPLVYVLIDENSFIYCHYVYSTWDNLYF